jgi:lipopolysaccharide export system protein LptA
MGFGQTINTDSWDHIRIEHADSLVTISTESKEVIELWGNVRMVQGDAYLYCDSSKWWKIEDHALLLGNVEIYDGKRTLNADRVDYEGKSHIEKASGRVILRTNNRELYADELIYFQENEIARAEGNIRIHDFIENATLRGHRGYYDRISDYTKIEVNPVLIMVDSVSNDTMTVKGLLLEAWGANQRFVATDSVQIKKKDMKAICGRAEYSLNLKTLELNGSPIVWQHDHRMKGDTILVRLKGVKFEGGHINGKGEIVTIDSTKEDILKGQIIEITASSDTIRKVTVMKQASSIYHIMDQDSGEEGVNSISGDHIVIDFEKGKINRVKVTSEPGQSSGVYKPDFSNENNRQSDNVRMSTENRDTR